MPGFFLFIDGKDLMIVHDRVAKIVAVLFLSCSFVGCGKEDKSRLEVYKVTGELYVDGQPAKHAVLTFHPTEIDPQHPMRPYALTNEEGRFAPSTYETGDGLPNGEYTITVEWRPFNVISNNFSGPDKLGEKFVSPEKSNLKVVVDGQAVEIPRIELQSSPQPAGKRR